MRTTIDLPEDLFRKTKLAAAQRGSTMRNLIIEGLKKTLQEDSPSLESSALPVLPTKGRKSYTLTNEQIESLLLNEETKHYGRSR